MKTVADIMSHLPIVAEVPGTRSDAINIMVRNGITGVPVVRSSDGKLVGIVSRKDIFRNFDEDQLSIIMKKDFITVESTATIPSVAKIFLDKRIHRIPVVKDGKLVGVITPTDFLDEIRELKTNVTAGEAITQTCATVYVNDPLSYVVSSMRVNEIMSLPVLDAKGDLVGIITDRDLFTDQTKDLDALREMGLDEADQMLAGYRNVLPLFYVATNKNLPEEYTVRDFMISKPTTVYKKTSLSEVAKIMKQNNFSQILVHGNKGELVGMIYDIDVLAALLR
ncbi:MAG: CBS domain-containing protein [archaeon]|nr:CBS domain-containing protein [archaeon]